MTTFDDRERAFENKFAHDEELRFRLRARRNKAVAAWANSRLGASDDVAVAYQDKVVALGLSGLSDEDLANRIAEDLSGRGQTVTPADIRSEMDRALAAAVEQERSP